MSVAYLLPVSVYDDGVMNSENINNMQTEFLQGRMYPSRSSPLTFSTEEVVSYDF